MQPLLACALSDVLSGPYEGKAALAAATPADLDNYDRHWGKLPGSAAGVVPRAAAEDYFSGELLQGDALERVMGHVVPPGAPEITREQFHEITHLVYAVLRRAQDRMFEEDAWLAELPAPAPSSSRKAKHAVMCDSISGWTIGAVPAGGLVDAAGLEGAAPGPLEAGVTGAAPGVPVSLLSPSILHARPLERGVLAAVEEAQDSAASEGGGEATVQAAARQAQPRGSCGASASSLHSVHSYHTADADPYAGEISDFEAKLQGLMTQLQAQEAVLEACSAEGETAAKELAEQQAKLERLRALETQVRQELGQHQAAAAAAQAAVPAASWQAFGAGDSPPHACGQALSEADVFRRSFPNGIQRQEDVWDAFVAERGVGSVPETLTAGMPQPSPFHGLNLLQQHASAAYAGGQQAGGYAHHSSGFGGAPASPDVAPAGQHEIIGQMLEQMQLSPQPLQPSRLAACNTRAGRGAGGEVLGGVEPMTVAEREACEAAFEHKGFQQLGGMPRASAQQLYTRTGLPPGLFEHAWELADADGDRALSRSEFCVFMVLLRAAQKGRPMPLKLSWEQAQALLGPPPRIHVDTGKLRGALHRPGSQRGGGGGSEAGGGSERQPGDHHLGNEHSDADSDDGFESLTTMSVASSLRSRATLPGAGASAAIGQPHSRPSSGAAAAAAARERVAAWSEEDPSHTGVEITIVSTGGVRYTKPLDRPFFSVSVRDSLGRLVEMPQDTPPGHFHRARGTIDAGHAVALQTPLQKIPPGSVLYVEIKHWKSDAKKFSTLAWAHAPLERLVDFGPVACRVRQGAVDLHLYKKPVAEGPTALKHARRLTSHPDLHLSLRGVV